MSRAHPAGPRHGDVLSASQTPLHPDAADLNRLDPGIWPLTTVRQADGVMSVGGLSLVELARDLGTPVFVLDEADARARMKAFREAYSDADVYYAAKAFLCTTFAKWLVEEGLGIDVCTAGELEIARRAGVPGSRILMHGNNKSVAELHAAVAEQVGFVVVDSLQEIERLADVSAAAGVVTSVLVRLTVGVEAHTHEFIATAHEDQKFGLSLASGAALDGVRAVLRHPSLRLAGLHSHIGSQIFDAAGFEVAAARVVRFAASIKADLGVEVDHLNLGGGMGIAYVPGDQPLEAHSMGSAIRGILARECQAAGMTLPRLMVEPGRAIVGPSAVTVYEIGTVKPVELDGGATRTYVSVDGGMSDNIRTALYDADYTVRLASRLSTAPSVLTRVVGKHCESGDIVVRDAWLPGDVAPGDLLAVAATGAYCRAMASSYNAVPRPPVVAVHDGAATVILRRETLDDLLALDPGA